MPAAAHAELVSSDPADGATVPVSPAGVTVTFDEATDAGRSRLRVRDARGATLAEGAVPDDDPSRMTMRSATR